MAEIMVTEVIHDFPIIMMVAASHGIEFSIKKPIIIGYIGAGIIIGPYAAPFSFILHAQVLNFFALIGILLLLLFVVALNIRLHSFAL